MSKLPFSEQITALVQLQEVDLKVLSLEEKKSNVPGELRKIQQDLSEISKEIQANQTEFDELQKNVRQVSAAIELNQDRLARANKRLEEVQNNQEFQAITKEIDQLKKMAEDLEKQKKSADENFSGVDARMSELKARMDELDAKKKAHESEVNEKMKTVDADISSLDAERQAHIQNVDRGTLSRYDRVRKARGGVGIVPAIGGRCSGCNMMLPPQFFNELRRMENLTSCPSCQRLLFYKETES